MASSKRSLTFRIFRGDQLVREERLAQAVIKVGKVPSAHLRIDDEAVSRMHAIIEVSGEDVFLVDLGSTRGTFVNGQKVTKAKLCSGDVIAVGDSRVEIEMAEAAAEAAPAAIAPAAPVVVPATSVFRTTPLTPPPAPLPRREPTVVSGALAAPAASPALLPAAVPVSAVAAAAPAEPASGPRAVEVAAMLGDSVVGVAHCVDPRGGKLSNATWALAAGGLACLLASATAFYVAVDNAASNHAALERHTRELRPAYAFRPHELGGLVGGVALGGLAIGLAAATLALARARAERRSPAYRIGTAPGVEQPVEGAPSASFPLVAPSGDDFVFNYGPGIEGELLAGGTSTPLAELAATGRARPSAVVPGALELPIPAAARIRARAGGTTFLISSVARPTKQATSVLAALEGRTAKYVAGSLVAHLGVVLLLSQVAIADSGANVVLTSDEPLAVVGRLTVAEDAPRPPDEDDDAGGPKDADGKEPTSMALDAGRAGDPKQADDRGTLRLKDRGAPPQIGREQELEQAREEARIAGVLGSAALHDSVRALASDVDFTSGFDADDQWGSIDGVLAGAGRGSFGTGVSGDGRGGGCFMPPCGTIATTARYGTLGRGKYAGDGYTIGNGKGTMRNHVALAPKLGPPKISDDGLDKAIIKRHIKQREAQIAYCYEKELLARPGIAGEVLIQFLIGPTGQVQSSTGTGFDATVASCVANVIQTIAFPATKSGAAVGVNYPFVFRTASQR